MLNSRRLIQVSVAKVCMLGAVLFSGVVEAQNTSISDLADIGAWRLLKTSWSPEDETGYSNFVRAIGKSGCRTVDSCVRSPANPYRATDPTPEQYTFWSDCADWPYFLRSYYAWKNGLPMVFSQGMVPLPLNDEQKNLILQGKTKEQPDVRYSRNGNFPSRRVRLPDARTGVTNFFRSHQSIQDTVHTATFRVDPRTNLGDMYSPAVQRGAIRPGTAVYDPAGHVGVVYDVTADGQVMVFDALIDRKSISPRRPYSLDVYKRSKIEHGGWFQNFRPVVIENAQYDSRAGSYVGGQPRLLTNAEIPDFSIEMFGNTQTADSKKAYLLQNNEVTSLFQEFLRRRMFQGKYSINILTEFKLSLKAVCDDFAVRLGMVQEPTTKGIASQPHMPVLPDTIFGGHGDWDLFSTPGSDLRRRAAVEASIALAKELKNQVDRRNPEFSYQGSDAKADLISVAQQSLNSCSVSYKNSAGRPVSLNLEALIKRMPLMSFSPWHCIELRWGATSSQELATCADINDPVKMRWYKAQQSLRNQKVRDTNIFTGYSLEELEKRSAELGPVQPENFNFIQRLQSEL